MKSENCNNSTLRNFALQEARKLLFILSFKPHALMARNGLEVNYKSMEQDKVNDTIAATNLTIELIKIFIVLFICLLL